jgi:toxin ParE1/3/4
VTKIRLSVATQTDIQALLVRSALAFGDDARKRYERLIASALDLISEDTSRGSLRNELRAGLRVFHLSLAKRQARRLGPTVKHPRHFVVYRQAAADIVEVVRVLHDAMDLEQHLPPPED